MGIWLLFLPLYFVNNISFPGDCSSLGLRRSWPSRLLGQRPYPVRRSLKQYFTKCSSVKYQCHGMLQKQESLLQKEWQILHATACFHRNPIPLLIHQDSASSWLGPHCKSYHLMAYCLLSKVSDEIQAGTKHKKMKIAYFFFMVS